jgi:hypothetical protein
MKHLEQKGLYVPFLVSISSLPVHFIPHFEQ